MVEGDLFLSSARAADIASWRAAAAHGHELANHTIFHPSLAATFPADPRYTLEAYKPDSLLREIAQQNVSLTSLDGRSRHGFATPCGQTLAGGDDYLEPLRRSGLVTRRSACRKRHRICAPMRAGSIPCMCPLAALPKGRPGAND